MKLEIIQNGTSSLYSVYVVRDYLSNDKLSILNNIIRSLTETDSMNRKTNVKANMTDYNKLKSIPECQNLFLQTIHTLDSIVKLRSCHTAETYKYFVTDAWGMQHLNEDYTQIHFHYPSDWSCAFYTEVPVPAPQMEFLEFASFLPLETNMLVLFPGMVKHSVNANQSKNNRISLAFNIDVEKQ